MAPDPPAPRPERPAATGALPSAAPSTGARVLAVAAIVLAGLCGGLIGYGVVDLQSTSPTDDGGVSVGAVIGGLVGAVLAAAGVAVVAVLVLRAMTEWQTIEDKARAEGRPPPPRRNVTGWKT
jgi:hypothetical protein